MRHDLAGFHHVAVGFRLSVETEVSVVVVANLLNHHGAFGRRLEDVLPEPGGEGCDLAIQFSQVRLIRGAQLRARAYEVRVVAGQKL